MSTSHLSGPPGAGGRGVTSAVSCPAVEDGVGRHVAAGSLQRVSAVGRLQLVQEVGTRPRGPRPARPLWPRDDGAGGLRWRWRRRRWRQWALVAPRRGNAAKEQTGSEYVTKARRQPTTGRTNCKCLYWFVQHRSDERLPKRGTQAEEGGMGRR